MKLKYIKIIILVILAISAYVCYTLNGGGRNGVALYQLPLLCFVCFSIFSNINKNLNKLSILTISLVCIIRYGIYPLTISLENSTGSNYVNYSSEACNLMMYEMFVVLFFVNVYSKRLLNCQKTVDVRIPKYKLTNTNKVLLFLTIPLIFIFPSLLGFFSFLGISKSAIPISGVFVILFKIGLYIGYLFLLSKCSKNGKGGLLYLFVAFVITILFVFMISFGDNSVSRWAILWIGIPSIIVISSLFPKYKKSITLFSIIVIPLSIILGSFIKFEISDYSASSFFLNFLNSNMLGEYFGGLNGLTYSMDTVAYNAKTSTLYSALTDLFCGFPLLSSLFDFENYSTQSIYLDYLGRKDLICPLLGQSYLHFGFIGAPFYSILMVLLAIEFDRISLKAKDVYVKYIANSLCISFSLFMCLNTIIIFTNAWALIIFLIIQIYTNKE